MTTYRCGCINAPSGRHGVLRSVRKCDRHKSRQRAPESLGEAYYAELGTVRDGRPAATRHVLELEDALGSFPPSPDRYAWALEIGPGASPYVSAIRAAGYQYHAIEPSEWAAQWLRKTHGVIVHHSEVERVFWNRDSEHLILAAHVLEHLKDPLHSLRHFAWALVPGGELWVIVPDDSDMLNPDHLWFFTEETLVASVEGVGLEIEQTDIRRIVERENFIYLRARKPVV
jgi:hypothetical protein